MAYWRDIYIPGRRTNMNYTRITAASLAIATMTLVGCSGDSSKTDSTALKNDSALAANLALANKDSATLTLSDTANSAKRKAPPTVTKTGSTGSKTTPTKTTPTKTAPAPTPTAPATRTGMIAAGTTLALASSSEI